MDRTVPRTMEVLEIISKHDEMSLADLVKVTGYPETSVHDTLHALGKCAMIYRCIDKACYGIGFRVYAIGRSYSKNSDLLSGSCQCMKALVEDTGKAVLLDEIDGEKILYTVGCEPKHPVVITPSIGGEGPTKNTAFAKIVEVFTHHEKKICQLSKEEKNRIRTEKPTSCGLDGPGPSYSITNPIYSFETELSEMVGVLSVKETGVDYLEELKKVRGCAGKISERLGFI